MSSLTMVAFSFSKRLLWEPDHWMISCKKKETGWELSFCLSHLSTCLTSSPVSPPHLSHLSQVQYKTVSMVETVPADRNLRRPDNTSTLDLQQPLNLHIIGHNMLEPWGHAPFLCEKKWCHQCHKLFSLTWLVLYCSITQQEFWCAAPVVTMYLSPVLKYPVKVLDSWPWTSRYWTGAPCR